VSRGRVCVVGAANIDLISYVPRLPRLGETLHGTSFQIGYGGKGANQAVMAAKLGWPVSLVCLLGEDAFGAGALANLRACGVDTTHVGLAKGALSGVAPIAVDADGNNAIIIVTGANDLLSPEHVERARQAIAAADVLVCQLEVELETTLAALRLAREEGCRTVFNPAPSRSDLPEEIYALSDVICPNEPETELLTGMAAGGEAARELLRQGAKAVVLTLGEQGCLVVTEDESTHVPAPSVRAVDTTGAGDAFVGSLACFLADGRPLVDAAERANQVAAASVRERGTQTSFPAAADLPAGLLA
jgi:ribokinase